MNNLKNGLDFNVLREANTNRIPTFKNRNGALCHNHDGSDWSINDWLTALAGELGEFANVAKKYRRGDITFEEFKSLAASELPDIQIYLDILAFRCGVDLGNATITKFNEFSDRVNSPIKIYANGKDWYTTKTNKEG